jgi:hypothetical protein
VGSVLGAGRRIPRHLQHSHHRGDDGRPHRRPDESQERRHGNPRQDGDEVTIDFLDDIAELQFVHTAGNPFLPLALIQQPKAWMLLLEADYAILLTMAANLLRLQLTNLDVADILGC